MHAYLTGPTWTQIDPAKLRLNAACRRPAKGKVFPKGMAS